MKQFSLSKKNYSFFISRYVFSKKIFPFFIILFSPNISGSRKVFQCFCSYLIIRLSVFLIILVLFVLRCRWVYMSVDDLAIYIGITRYESAASIARCRCVDVFQKTRRRKTVADGKKQPHFHPRLTLDEVLEHTPSARKTSQRRKRSHT